MVLAATAARAQIRPGATPSEDTTQVATAEDSLRFRARITPARLMFDECAGVSFKTCASQRVQAQLSSDGVAYGVLITRSNDGRSVYLWQIGRMGTPGGGAAGGRGGAGGRRGGRGGGRGGGGGGRGRQRP